ncbi:MAG: hypothetical protein DRO39_07055 [Thermoprotei archaeon]|nr:MAG: hypothetical protein DRO39_07055 [Thermoprotei archaeon]
MDLRGFKAKWLARLVSYEPRSSGERAFRDELIMRVSNMRRYDAARLALDIGAMMRRGDVSEEFRSMLREMLRDIESLAQGGEHG